MWWVRRLTWTIALALAATTLTTPAHADGALDRYYTQVLDWQQCGSHECARLTVPLDYANPDNGDITLALERVLHSGPTSQGAIVVNPGGPGVPGTGFASVVASDIAPAVAAEFDIVGFDPRGTGSSSPVTCLSDAQTARWLDADPTPDTPAEVRRIMTLGATIPQGCLTRSPSIARHLGTESTVHDLDIMRAALGQPTLNLLGFSYGTLLGARYAERFPATVGRMLLDGAVDPRLDAMQISAGQSAGFQQAISRFAADCASRTSCPYGRTKAGVLRGINALLARLDRRPMPTHTGAPLLEAQAISALFATLYDKAAWPQLRTALAAAKHDDGTDLQQIAYQQSERIGPASFAGNFTSAFYAISCWDDPATPKATGLSTAARRWAATAAVPAMAQAMSWGNAPCSSWFGHSARKPAAVHSTTTAPIVVVGTTHDPATPYAWARSLARQLPTSTLVTFDGDGHTAYGNDSPCLQSILDRYLLTGSVPAAGTRCA